MKLEGRLATNIDAMSQYQARDTLAELNKAFAGKRGRIVFQKDAHGNLTGATRDRGFWSGIKAVISTSYRERLQATEREFGALCAKAAGQSVDGALIIDGLRRDRRLQERADPVAAHFREYGISDHGGVAGQLTPGLMEHAARGFDFSDKTPIERLEHELEIRAFKPPIDGRQVFTFENSPLENYKLEAAQWNKLGASADQGGHGGTLKGKLTLKNGQEAEVFLKPFDGVEAKNYELIARMTDGKLDAFLPKIHGRVTDSRGKQFLIMENTLRGQRRQFGDIKIAGKVEGLENPIADQDEMVFTRGKQKSSLDFWQMKHGATAAPDFMFAKDMAVLGKVGRFFNYQHSETSLHAALGEAKPTAEGLHRLAGRIRELKNLLSESPVALIGGSVMIIRNEDGELIPMLIDPAHVQYDPALKDRFGDCGAFYGEPDNFALRKASGRSGLEALEQSIETLANRM